MSGQGQIGVAGPGTLLAAGGGLRFRVDFPTAFYSVSGLFYVVTTSQNKLLDTSCDRGLDCPRFFLLLSRESVTQSLSRSNYQLRETHGRSSTHEVNNECDVTSTGRR